MCGVFVRSNTEQFFLFLYFLFNLTKMETVSVCLYVWVCFHPPLKMQILNLLIKKKQNGNSENLGKKTQNITTKLLFGRGGKVGVFTKGNVIKCNGNRFCEFIMTYMKHLTVFSLRI